jgi:hypothetical protein
VHEPGVVVTRGAGARERVAVVGSGGAGTDRVGPPLALYEVAHALVEAGERPDMGLPFTPEEKADVEPAVGQAIDLQRPANGWKHGHG